MEINICFSSDNNYVQHLAVAITSILKNSSEEDNYNFFIMDGGITQKNKNKIEELKKIKDFNISFVLMDDNDFKNCPMTSYVNYITLPTYYRFKIPSIFPNIDKILYLDCDIVVTHDIKQLYETDISNYYLAAIPEVFNHCHKERMAIEGDYYYCNAGILLINNKKWREDNIEQKLFDYALHPTKEIVYQDQDIINEVLKYKIKYLHLRWNLQHDSIWDDSYLFHIDERLAALEDPYIVHFTHKYKPWTIECTNKFKVLYYKYLKLTPYKGDFYRIKLQKCLFDFTNLLKSLFYIKKEYSVKTIKFFGIKLTITNKYKKLLEELHSIKFNNMESIKCDIESMKKVIQEQKEKVDNLYRISEKTLDHIMWIDHPIYCINNGVNTIFRYMTGLQLTKDYQTERVVVFDPNEAPVDHFERYSFVKNFINPDDDVMDIACGVGYGSAYLAKKAKSVMGVDINQPSIDFAKKIFTDSNLSYICMDATKVNFDKRFDKIVSFETIEHLVDDELFVKKLNESLKSYGKLICSVPNQTIFPYDKKIVPFHIKHYTVDDITSLLSRNGFVVEDIYFQYAEENHRVMKKDKEGYTIVCIAKKGQ